MGSDIFLIFLSRAFASQQLQFAVLALDVLTTSVIAQLVRCSSVAPLGASQPGEANPGGKTGTGEKISSELGHQLPHAAAGLCCVEQIP